MIVCRTAFKWHGKKCFYFPFQVFSQHLQSVLDEIGGESFRAKEANLVQNEWANIISQAYNTIHTEDIGVIVGNLTNEEVTLGIKQVFSRMAAEKLLNNAKKRRKLPKRILRYRQHNYLNSTMDDYNKIKRTAGY